MNTIIILFAQRNLFNEMNGTKKYSTVKYYVNIDFVSIVCL